MQGQGVLVQRRGALLLAPLTRHVGEVDQGERRARPVPKPLVEREALLVRGPRAPDAAPFERRGTEVAKRVGDAPLVPALPEKGKALLVARDGARHIPPPALDVSQSVERDGTDGAPAQPPAQGQALLAQLCRAVVVAARPGDLPHLDEDGGDADLVADPSEQGEALPEQPGRPRQVALPEGQLARRVPRPGGRLDPRGAPPRPATVEVFRDKPLDPLAPLAHVTAYPPEPAQRTGQAQPGLKVAGLPRPPQGFAQVVVLALEPVQLCRGFRPQQLRLRGLG